MGGCHHNPPFICILPTFICLLFALLTIGYLPSIIFSLLLIDNLKSDYYYYYAKEDNQNKTLSECTFQHGCGLIVNAAEE